MENNNSNSDAAKEQPVAHNASLESLNAMADAQVPENRLQEPPPSPTSLTSSPAIEHAPIAASGSVELDGSQMQQHRSLGSMEDDNCAAESTTAATNDDEGHATIRECTVSADQTAPHDANVEEIISTIKKVTGCQNVSIRESGEIDILPSGWTTRESRSHGGKKYFVSPHGQTQWFRPFIKTGVGYNWVHEIEVTFGPGRLGLNLKQIVSEPGVEFSDIQVYIAEIYKLPNGLASPAEIYNWGVKPEKRLYVGMRMTAIDGVPLTGYSYPEALEKLNKAPRPVRIKFADISKGIVGRVEEAEPIEESEQEKEVKAARSMQNSLRLEYLRILVACELHLEVWSACRDQMHRKELELQKKWEIVSSQVEQLNESTKSLENDEKTLVAEQKTLEETIHQLTLQESGQIPSAEATKMDELTERNHLLDEEIAGYHREIDGLRKEKVQLQDEMDGLNKQLGEIGEEDLRPNSVVDADVAALLHISLDRNLLDKGLTDEDRNDIMAKVSQKVADLDEEMRKEEERVRHLETEILQFKKQLATANAASKREDDLISGERPPQLVFLENKIENLRKNLRDAVGSMAKATAEGDAAKADSLSLRRTALKDELKAALDEMQKLESKMNVATRSSARRLTADSVASAGSNRRMTVDSESHSHVDVDVDADVGDIARDGSARLQAKITRLRSDLHETVGRLSRASSGHDVELATQLSARRLQLKDEIRATQDELNSIASSTNTPTISPASAAASVLTPIKLPPGSRSRRSSEPQELRSSTASRESSESLTSFPHEIGSASPLPPDVRLPRMQGLLQKNPTHSNDKGMFGNMSLRGLRERWCEIDSTGCLKYYKRKGDREPRGMIPLSNPSLEVVYQKNDLKVVEFMICTTSHQTKFVAKTHEDLQKWVHALTTANAILKQRDSNSQPAQAHERPRQASVSSTASGEHRATLGF